MSICVDCGLCCDGTLFTHLAVADDTDLGRPLLALGVEIIVEHDPPVFALPCPALANRRCSIYDLHRPHACQQFECRLLRDVTHGRLDETEARGVISTAHALRAEQATGDDVGLEVHLDRWFRNAG